MVEGIRNYAQPFRGMDRRATRHRAITKTKNDWGGETLASQVVNQEEVLQSPRPPLRRAIQL